MQELTPSGTAQPLVAAIIGLAALAEDSPEVDRQLDRIVRLTATLVDEVAYASVTRLLEGRPTTVALSDDVAQVLDDAQYSAGGPCMAALTEEKVVVADLTRTVEWPEFRQKASALGLRATLSVPLTAARGSVVAALNLHGVDRDAMARLGQRVWAALAGSTAEVDAPRTPAQQQNARDGGSQLVAGLVQAIELTRMVRTAVRTVAAEQGVDEEEAYELLRVQAAGHHSSLLRTAIEVAVRGIS